ncbi:substrate-binding periplasmic protein [Litoribacillus peritrichatus]|uniref:Transporter substrate-binding domain-containing protein n=1 Tax=Litoribacillus peritrichatus TaxID=718191 RepID=A0ABP7MTQ6_9GAMM
MIRAFSRLLSFCLMLFSTYSVAETLKIGVGLALPPYVLPSTNTGIEVDIVREALAVKGYKITPTYLPFARVPIELSDKRVDAAMTVNESSGLTKVFYSDTHVTYQNVAISLQANNFKIDHITDLKAHSIIAFQDATKYLGETFLTMAKSNKRYREYAKQSKQITMLFSKRVETVVMDINIFKYFRREEKSVDTSQPYTVHEIFPPSQYKMAFLSQNIRDDFNEGLKMIKSSGQYDKIVTKYIQ